MEHMDMQWIAGRAYAIWEEEGRPEGRQDEHWLIAERDFQMMQEGERALANLPDEAMKPKKPAAKPRKTSAKAGTTGGVAAVV